MAMVMFPPTANQFLRKPGKQKEGGCIILTQDTLDWPSNQSTSFPSQCLAYQRNAWPSHNYGTTCDRGRARDSSHLRNYQHRFTCTDSQGVQTYVPKTSSPACSLYRNPASPGYYYFGPASATARPYARLKCTRRYSEPPSTPPINTSR